jgi:SAM-dependent methyltransferase
MDNIDRTFIEALFTANYYMGYQALERYIVKVIFGILRNMNITDYLQKDYRTTDEIVERFNLHVQSKALLNWILTYLGHMGYVKSRDSGFALKKVVSHIDTHEDRKQLAELMPTADIFIQLITHIETDIKNFLTGKKSGGEILFADETVSHLWNDYFNNTFYEYSFINYGAAYGIAKWLSQTEEKSMLEIGSGTSGATVRVFQTLRDNNLLESMDTIILTDIVPSLLDLGNKNIQKHVKAPPAYEQRILDINKPFREQGFSEDSFDIIYGVNVLHVAHDLDFSLREVYKHLNNDGILVIAETTRPFENRALHHEIIFELLENYYDVKLDPEMRPYHGFLTKEGWIRYFEMSGFKNIEYINELERHDKLDFDIKPLHSFLVIKGQK